MCAQRSEAATTCLPHETNTTKNSAERKKEAQRNNGRDMLKRSRAIDKQFPALADGTNCVRPQRSPPLRQRMLTSFSSPLPATRRKRNVLDLATFSPKQAVTTNHGCTRIQATVAPYLRAASQNRCSFSRRRASPPSTFFRQARQGHNVAFCSANAGQHNSTRRFFAGYWRLGRSSPHRFGACPATGTSSTCCIPWRINTRIRTTF